MCRRKPGPRCHKHARTSLEAANRRVATAAGQLRRATTSQGRTAAEEKVRDATRTLVWAERDFDGTRTGAEQLNDVIDRLPDGEPRHQLERRAAAAQVYRAARNEHAKLMPPIPNGQPLTPDAVSAYNELGRTREQLAQWETADVLDEHPDPAQAAARREWLETEAFNQDVAFRVTSTGAADMDHLDPVEAKQLAVGNPELADRITFISHARAAVATGAHPDRIAALIAAKDAALTSEITAAASSGEAAPYQGRSKRRSKKTYPEPVAEQPTNEPPAGDTQAEDGMSQPSDTPGPSDKPGPARGADRSESSRGAATRRALLGAVLRGTLIRRGGGGGGNSVQQGKYLASEVIGAGMQVK